MKAQKNIKLKFLYKKIQELELVKKILINFSKPLNKVITQAQENTGEQVWGY